MASETVVALVGLGGVVVGATASILSARLTSASTEKIARADRNQHARLLAASGFAKARAAVSSLHPNMLSEADVLPLPPTVDRVHAVRSAELAEALGELDQVSALLSGSQVGSAAAAVARELVVFSDSWSVALVSASQLHASIPPSERDMADSSWSRALGEVRRSRAALLGYSGASTSEEAGTHLGGLLGGLATVIGSM
jgi:hypothetical protein